MARKTQEQKNADKDDAAASQRAIRTQLAPAGKADNPAAPTGVSKETINAGAHPRR